MFHKKPQALSAIQKKVNIIKIERVVQLKEKERDTMERLKNYQKRSDLVAEFWAISFIPHTLGKEKEGTVNLLKKNKYEG